MNAINFESMYSCRNVLALDAMTALYCRLSVDDANDGDSNSIQNHFYTFQGELPSAENRNDTVAVIIESVPIAAPCTTSERWFWRN